MAEVVDVPATETPVVDAPPPTAPPAEPSWRDSLPDDLKGAAWLSKYKTPEDALRGFAEAQKLIGSKLSVPKDDAPKEEWDKFYASLGRPEAPDKYDLGVPETLPEGVAALENVLTGERVEAENGRLPLARACARFPVAALLAK